MPYHALQDDMKMQFVGPSIFGGEAMTPDSKPACFYDCLDAFPHSPYQQNHAVSRCVTLWPALSGCIIRH